MSELLSRRTLVTGLAALGCTTACKSPEALHTIWSGQDEDKVQIQLDSTGLKAWVYLDQVYVRTGQERWNPALTPLRSLGRSLKPGDRVVIIHQVRREMPRWAKISIIVYDVLIFAAVITLSIVTFGSGAAALPYAFIDPNMPLYEAVVKSSGEFLRDNAPAELGGSIDEPRFRNLERSDVALFYQTDPDGPILGPGTTWNIHELHLWGNRNEWRALNQAVVEWLHMTEVSYIHTLVRSLLYTVSRQPLRTRLRTMAPIALSIYGGTASSVHEGVVPYSLRYHNDFGPPMHRMLIAMRLPRGLRLLTQRASSALSYRTGEVEGGSGTVHWWHTADLGPDDKGKIKLKVEVDMRRL